MSKGKFRYPVSLGVRLTTDAAEQIRAIAADRNLNVGKVIREAVEVYLRQREQS
jgi:hypothetical protein